MFGNKKRIRELEAEVENLWRHLKFEADRIDSRVKMNHELCILSDKRLFALANKPKYKAGDKVFFYNCCAYVPQYTQVIVVSSYLESNSCGDIMNYYKCIDSNGKEYKLNESIILKTKPNRV